MATENKDFKVKNGLFVGEGGHFEGPVTVADPVHSQHAVTKAYVDALSFSGGGDGGGGGSITVAENPPSVAIQGTGWYNAKSGRLYIYYDSSWIEITAGFGESAETAPANLPQDPDIDDKITIGERTWQWDGFVWNSLDLDNRLIVAPSQEGEDLPSVLFVGTDAPDTQNVSAGDLWTDTDDDAGSTEFIFSGPEEPENFDQNTLWIDTDEPELPLIYSDNEPPTYTPIEGDFWVDLDDLTGQLVVTSTEEPDPDDANLWIDLNNEAGYITYRDLFSENSSQVIQFEDLPDASNHQGMIAYVADQQALYVASGTSWTKIFPNYDAEALSWMGL